ncbi:hypothetical protein Bbelb_111880 [Branchiostoma belcheri]|nr:hypothetical protein Bbelb_111880 [Branchiostoma belcheri]
MPRPCGRVRAAGGSIADSVGASGCKLVPRFGMSSIPSLGQTEVVFLYVTSHVEAAGSGWHENKSDICCALRTELEAAKSQGQVLKGAAESQGQVRACVFG